MDWNISRGKAFAIILVAWALIYLPGLGKCGLRGEEGRRVLPGVEMLNSGDWILPKIAGADYYNKPPGINWLVAGSLWLTGQQTETAARLPSVIFVLAFVSLLIWMPIPWLDPRARCIAAAIFLSNIAIIEKGRMIEIEAVYVALTGIATLLWLNIWSRNGPRWLLWLAPSAILAFGMLVKGPFIVIFFYSVVIAVLAYSKSIRSLFSVWHFVGAAVIVLPFWIWLSLAFQETSSEKMSSRMVSELMIRIISDIDVFYWGQNVLREFTTFLPWLVFLPVLWQRKLTSRIEPQYEALFRGTRLGIVIGFCAISLMPRMEARYTMPVIPMVAVLMGWVLSLDIQYAPTDRWWKRILLAGFLVACVTAGIGWAFAPASPGRIAALVAAIGAASYVLWLRSRIENKPALACATAFLVGAFMLQYATTYLDIAVSREVRGPIGDEVNRLVPSGETVSLFKPGSYLYPTIFRLKRPVRYVLDPNEIDEDVDYMLIEQKDLDDPDTHRRIAARSLQVLHEFADTQPYDYRLVELE